MKSTSLQIVLVAALASACATGPAPASDTRPGTATTPAATSVVRQRTVLMTRSMQVFSGLEDQLGQALHKHDKAQIDHLLSSDFEFRTPASASETARADWLAMGPAAEVGVIDQISVHEFPGVAVASFMLSAKSPDGSAAARSYVVDVWTGKEGDWKLITRYRSPLPANQAPQEDIAPTGKG